MLRIKGMVLGPNPPEWAAARWRMNRALSLARMIAWYRRGVRYGYRHDFARNAIADAAADCGWPKLSWLKRHVREAAADIEHNLDCARGG